LQARIDEALAHARAAEEEVAAQLGAEARTRYWALHYDEQEQARLWARLEPLWRDRYSTVRLTLTLVDNINGLRIAITCRPGPHLTR
jgi:hypothetical protein